MEASFGERLRDLRVEKGLSQKALGQVVGLAGNSIANYELGVREPSFEILKALCKFFNVTSDYLIGLSDF